MDGGFHRADPCPGTAVFDTIKDLEQATPSSEKHAGHLAVR